MKKTFSQGGTIPQMILISLAVAGMALVMVTTKRTYAVGGDMIQHPNYYVIASVSSVFAVMILLRSKLILNFKDGSFRPVTSFLWIPFGKKFYFSDYDAFVMKVDVQQFRVKGRKRSAYLYMPGFASRKTNQVIELYSKEKDEIYSLYQGKKNVVTAIALELAQNCPELKSYKEHIKPGNEFDFTKLKRK